MHHVMVNIVQHDTKTSVSSTLLKERLLINAFDAQITASILCLV